MPDENPNNAVLLEKIVNLSSSCARIEGWLNQVNARTIKHGRLLAIHSSLLGLVGAGIVIVLTKIPY